MVVNVMPSQTDSYWYKTCIHHCEPDSKWQGVEWKHPQSTDKKKFKSQPFTGQLILTVFWD
jgi:hypothetical protein